MVKKLISNLSVVFCLLVLGVFILSLYNINSFIETLEEKLVISAFLMEDFSDGKKINNSITKIKKMSSVKNVSYVSKEKALDEFLLRTPELDEQIKVLGNNPLPASLEVELAKSMRIDNVKKLIRQLSNLQEIKSVEYPELEVKKLVQARKFFNRLSLVLGILLVCSVVIIIFQINWLNFELNQQNGKANLLKESMILSFLSGIVSLILLYALFNIFLREVSQLKFLPLGYLTGILLLSISISGAAYWYFRKMYSERCLN